MAAREDATVVVVRHTRGVFRSFDWTQPAVARQVQPVADRVVVRHWHALEQLRRNPNWIDSCPVRVFHIAEQVERIQKEGSPISRIRRERVAV